MHTLPLTPHLLHLVFSQESLRQRTYLGLTSPISVSSFWTRSYRYSNDTAQCLHCVTSAHLQQSTHSQMASPTTAPCSSAFSSSRIPGLTDIYTNRHEIAFVFGQLLSTHSVPALVRVLQDSSESDMVRHEAAEALGGIATPEVLPHLKEWMQRPDAPRVVKESCQVALDMWEVRAYCLCFYVFSTLMCSVCCSMKIRASSSTPTAWILPPVLLLVLVHDATTSGLFGLLSSRLVLRVMHVCRIIHSVSYLQRSGLDPRLWSEPTW